MNAESNHSQEPEKLYHELNSTELLQLAREGDATALEQLYYHFRDQLLKYVWIVTGNHDRAVTTVKQAFEDFFALLETEQELESVQTFLFQQAENTREEAGDLDPVSTQSGWELSSETLSGEGDWTGPASDQGLPQTSKQFVRCFSKLPEPLRIAAGLYLLGPFPVDQIMKITGASADAIRARINEALRRIRVCLQEHNPGPTQTHTDTCSMANERTWFRFHTGNRSSDSSTLVKHRKKCQECMTVSQGIERLQEHLDDFKELDLSPFPKGDESDLLEEARKTAANVTSASTSTPDMDPDLKQVLWLIPWGFALVVLLSIAPSVVQNWNDVYFSTSDKHVSNSNDTKTVFLDAGEQSVKQITIRIRGRSTTLNELQVQPLHPESNVQLQSDVRSKNGADSRDRTYRIHFSKPYPSAKIRVLLLSTQSNRHLSSILSDVRMVDATGPSGTSISARVYLKSN